VTGTPFEPYAVGEIELAAIDPEVRLVAPGTLDYASVLVLVRANGDPVDLVRVPLTEGHATIDRPPIAEASSLPAGRTPQVSVIVPTIGRGAQLRRALESLTRLDYACFEVIVVDNRPSDPQTREVVEELDCPHLRYVAEPNPGTSAARNRGIAVAAGEILAFTDDDVVADPAWLTELVAEFNRDAETTCVTGLVLPFRFDTEAQEWFEAYGGFSKGFERLVFDLGPNRSDDRLYPFSGGVFGSGNNMACRAQPLRAIGGFDPFLGAGSKAQSGEDIEVLTHAVLAGGRLVYTPRALVWHEHRTEYAELREQLSTYGAGFTAALTKWCLRRPSLAARLAKGAIPAVRFVFSKDSQRNKRKTETYPAELSKRELAGYLAGPFRYLYSVMWARAHGFQRRPWTTS
jgi:GT2 family glycosyltransferase